MFPGSWKADEPFSEVPNIPLGEPLDLVVLAVKRNAMRCRLLTSGTAVTFRPIQGEVEGEIATVLPTRVWQYKRTTYISGQVTGTRLDIPALNMTPLALKKDGTWNPEEADFLVPDDPFSKYYSPIIAKGPRPEYEMEQVIPGFDIDNADLDPIIQASEHWQSGEYEQAQKIMEEMLVADLRCLDAHAHLGNWELEGATSGRRLERARRHYEVGMRIAELSLGKDFNGLLPWGLLDNRPYLRCLHGYGLCVWKLGRAAEARCIFKRILWLNPMDNQGVRFLLADIDCGKPWEDDETDANSTDEPHLQYFDDDGSEINPDLISKPSLCLSCRHDNDPEQEVLCNLNRMDHQDDQDFKCGAFDTQKNP